MLILGVHMSIAKGFQEAARRTADVYGANAMQVFTKNPRGRGAKPILKKDAKEFKTICKKEKIEFVSAHSSYLLNFAKSLPKNHWSFKDIKLDLERVTLLGGVGSVLHIGKRLELDYEVAEKYLSENIFHILKITEKTGALLILENTAGQGSEMGTNFKQLASLYKKLKKHKRVKFCLDTCHTFAAGYDWTKGPNKIFKEFDKQIGLKNLVCMHFNDSMKEVNSKRDRHDNIGKGKIGLKNMKNIAMFAKKHSIPLILETPEKTITHEQDLKVVRSMI